MYTWTENAMSKFDPFLRAYLNNPSAGEEPTKGQKAALEGFNLTLQDNNASYK